MVKDLLPVARSVVGSRTQRTFLIVYLHSITSPIQLLVLSSLGERVDGAIFL